MRISVNLATRPFVELRPLYQRLRIIMAVLGVLAIVLGVWLHSATKRAHIAQAQMDALVQKTRGFQQERANNEARMHQPSNAAVLDRSQFLNALFVRKSFSWTAVMMDLENVLPAGVQVTNIEPQMLPDGELQIRLRISGDRERAVDLIKNLERSQCFVAPRLSSESAQTQDPNQRNNGAPVNLNAVEFDILAGYNPLPVHLRKKQPSETSEDITPVMKKASAAAKSSAAAPSIPHPANSPRPMAQPAGRRPQ
jgi:type IV pilus assembly protein PilN